jgi:hypothetical protein
MPALFKAWVWSHSLAGIVGSHSTREMEVCLLWFLCIIKKRSLRRVDQSSRGVIPSVVCPICVIAKPCKERPLPEIGSKSEIKKCVTFWDFLVQGVTPWRTRAKIYLHRVHMARQTRTFFLSNYNLFSDSNYEATHYAIFPNPAYVLRLKTTYSPQDSQFVFPGYAFFERRVSTRDPDVSFCRTRNSSPAFYSICCCNYLNYIISIAGVHISQSLIAISAIATKRLDGSEEFPFAQTTNLL